MCPHVGDDDDDGDCDMTGCFHGSGNEHGSKQGGKKKEKETTTILGAIKCTDKRKCKAIMHSSPAHPPPPRQRNLRLQKSFVLHPNLA